MAAKQQEVPASYTGDWIERLDGRTNIARAVRDRLHALETDLGGRDNLSYQQRALAKRAIWTEAVIEQREAALARGDEIDLGQLIQANNGLIGLLKALGLERRVRDVPDLQSYLRAKEAG